MWIKIYLCLFPDGAERLAASRQMIGEADAMQLARDDAYFCGCAAEARDLLGQSKDPLIRQALPGIAEGYETPAKRAERAEGIAKPARLSPGVLLGLQWAGRCRGCGCSDLTDSQHGLAFCTSRTFAAE
jgi:hypothetical protein